MSRPEWWPECLQALTFTQVSTVREHIRAQGVEPVTAAQDLRHSGGVDADLQKLAGARRSEPTGKLRVTTSLSFALSWLTQAMVEFQQAHPRIEVELLTVTADPVDVVGAAALFRK